MNELSGKKALIVDDEPDLREILCDQLSLEGVESQTAENGKVALEIFQKGNFDFILSDVRMPQGGGVELLEKVRALDKGKRIPFFLVTGFADYTLDEIFDRGADGVYPKPFDFEALLIGIKRSLLPDEVRFKRKDDRLKTDFLLEASFGEKHIGVSGEVVNLSRGGFFCSTPRPFPKVGQVVEFKFTFDAKAGVRAKVEGVGVCRWVRERLDPSSGDASTDASVSAGFGIEFLQLTDESRKAINQFLESQSGGSSFIPKK